MGSRLNKEREEQKARERDVARLANVTDDKDVEVVRQGKKVIIPEDMAYADAIRWIDRKREEDERVVAVREIVDAFPFDGAYAFMRALQDRYGWTSPVPTPSFFGEEPPLMLGIEIGVDKSVQVIWGRVEIPGIEGFLDTGIEQKDGRFVFRIGGEVKQKHKKEIAEIADATREFVRTRSIYRSKAIRISFDGGDFNPNDAPRFIDTSETNPDDLILSDSVKRLVDTALFTPILKTKECRQHKIPLKRGILLEGPYGTGKTLTANVAAHLCERNGWTFIYLSNIRQLQEAIYFAKQYQPALVFAEDIDRVVSGERNQEMDKILNTIDGVDTKSSEVIVVLTTNHVEQINRAMLRPGRLDAVISISAPDAKAVVQLIETYASGLIHDRAGLDQIGKKLAGQIPAVIREVVERSKLAAISRSGSPDIELTVGDLDIAADSMLKHLELMQPEEKGDMDLAEAVGVIGTYMNNHEVEEGVEVPDALKAIAENLGVKLTAAR